MDSDGDESSVASSDLNNNGIFIRDLRRVRRNDPRVDRLFGNGTYHDIVRNMTAGGWEDIGRDISNNTYLERLYIAADALDDEKLSSLFRGLTRSSSIVELDLIQNEISALGLRSLEPFLQNSTKLRKLSVSFNDIQTEGFNFLMQVLRDSPVESLYCSHCGITSIEIETVPKNLKFLSFHNNNIQSEGFDRLIRSLRDSSIKVLYCNNCCIEIVTNSFPRSLKTLHLNSNRINSNGCHEIAKLLREGDALEKLVLDNNSIDDNGVAILVDSLKTNTTLKELYLEDNNGISRNGRLLLLKMLNDISSIKATLQSNHTLQTIRLGEMNDDISHYINMATRYNSDFSGGVGREKVIQTQLHSKRRAELVTKQGVESQSVYGEIDPLHLPEVLSLVSRRHGHEELYVALKASIAEVISTVDRKTCLLLQRNYHISRTKQINAELERIEAAEIDIISGNTSNKRRRKWWWGIWG